VYLVDTNILLRLADSRHPSYEVARQAARSLERSGFALRTAPQNFIEFWNVVTRPADNNGLGLNTERAEEMLRFFERLFPPLPDLPATYQVWRKLVVDFKVSGVRVHDARLVAFMKVHDLKRILTFNKKDFLRFEPLGISPLEPAEVREE